MDKKLESLGMYESDKGFDIYSRAVEEIGLWKSEKIIIEKYCKNFNSEILDLGCGCGRTTFGLYKIGYKNIIGLDLCERFIKYANDKANKENLNLKFVVGDSSCLDFENDMFDLVFYSFNGLQLVPGYQNRVNILKESYRVLKNNGYMIFTAHDREIPAFKEFWNREKIKWDEGINDNSVECFGDMNIYENDGNGFIHYSSISELKEFIYDNSDFKIIEYISRDNLIEELEKVKEWSSDTIFWVLKKEM